MTDAQRITHALRGRWHGRYGTALCPAHDDHNPSLSLSNAPDGRLLVHCHAGCHFREVFGALARLGLVSPCGRSEGVQSDETARRGASGRESAVGRERLARKVWGETRPIANTIAEHYLRGRSISCDLPRTLRFHASCRHPTVKVFPAMVARVDGGEGFAVHRTYLRPDGSWKASVSPPKAMLGRVAGGAVRVTDQDGPLVVAEGIETALSLASGLLTEPATIWAALSTSGMTGLRLPDPPRRMIVAMDGDPAGLAAGHKLAERADALGWSVSFLAAPSGTDWNDHLLKLRGSR